MEKHIQGALQPKLWNALPKPHSLWTWPCIFHLFPYEGNLWGTKWKEKLLTPRITITTQTTIVSRERIVQLWVSWVNKEEVHEKTVKESVERCWKTNCRAWKNLGRESARNTKNVGVLHIGVFDHDSSFLSEGILQDQFVFLPIPFVLLACFVGN